MPLGTKWALFKWHGLREYCWDSHPVMTTVLPWLLPAGYLSLSWNQLRLVSLKWQWVHCTQMASIVTKSHSNRAPVGCSGCGRFSSWIYGWQICWCCVMLSCQYLRGTVLSLCPKKKPVLKKEKQVFSQYILKVHGPHKMAIYSSACQQNDFLSSNQHYSTCINLT